MASKTIDIKVAHPSVCEVIHLGRIYDVIPSESIPPDGIYIAKLDIQPDITVDSDDQTLVHMEYTLHECQLNIPIDISAWKLVEQYRYRCSTCECFATPVVMPFIEGLITIDKQGGKTMSTSPGMKLLCPRCIDIACATNEQGTVIGTMHPILE
jgi:hypothetical protein